MNALQAVMLLDKLKDEITALEMAVNLMEDKNIDSHLVDIVRDIKVKKFTFMKDLEDVMKDTELPKHFQ